MSELVDLFNLLGGVKAVGGLLVPLAAVGMKKSAARYARHRLLGLAAHRLDVMLTSSGMRNDPDVGFARPTTGRGSVQAFGTAVRAIGRYYRALPITVHFASRVYNTLDGDLLCIGGPRANEVTAEVLDSAVLRRISAMRFDDVHYCARIGDLMVDRYDLDAVNGVPRRDMGILLMCANPLTTKPRRAVVCCGFTSYGTAGVAKWFFDDVLTDSWRRPLAKAYGIPRRRIRADQCYVAVLEFRISDGTVIGEQVIFSGVFSAGQPELNRAGS